jgi:hypothetical protein
VTVSGNGGNSMKAADGVQIAERYTAQYAFTMAYKNTWPREYVKQLIEDLSRAEERERVLREALEWQPITPENLPKSGDEIYRAAGDRPNDVADVMAECGEYDAVELYHGYGFTHFRPINPPAAPEQLALRF